MRMSQKLVFHESKCICTIKRILSTTAMYVSSSSFMYLRFPCCCDARLNSSTLRVGLKTLLNTIISQFQVRNCAVPPQHLRSETSFSQTRKTLNLTVKRKALNLIVVVCDVFQTGLRFHIATLIIIFWKLWHYIFHEMQNFSKWLKLSFNMDNEDFTQVNSSSKNTTEKTQSLDIVWKLCLPTTIMLIMAEFWMTVSFMVFRFNSLRMKNKKQRTNSSSTTITFSIILLLLSIFPRLILTLSLAFVGYNASSEIDYFCEVVMDVSIAAYGIAFIPIYIFLWLRQRILYSQPFLRELYTKFVKCFSWGFIISFLIGDIVTVAFYILPLSFVRSKYGCESTFNGTYKDPNYAAFAIQAFGQSLLILLLLYPLWMHKKFQVDAF